LVRKIKEMEKAKLKKKTIDHDNKEKKQIKTN
jgi:hypothetical protein